jgi:hypothetical protein
VRNKEYTYIESGNFGKTMKIFLVERDSLKNPNFQILVCGEGKKRETVADGESAMATKNYTDEIKYVSSFLMVFLNNLIHFFILNYRLYTYQDSLSKNSYASCTSTIISDRFLVTAAHCFDQFNE